MENNNLPSRNSNHVRHRNELAALLSIIPGLGHIFKGHILMGICIMLVFPGFLYMSILFAIFTAGVSLFIPITYMGVIGWLAYNIEDKRLGN